MRVAIFQNKADVVTLEQGPDGELIKLTWVDLLNRFIENLQSQGALIKDIKFDSYQYKENPGLIDSTIVFTAFVLYEMQVENIELSSK